MLPTSASEGRNWLIKPWCSGQGQELDAAGQADGCAQSQEPEVIVMAVPGSLVAGVGHGEAAASDLLIQSRRL